MNKKVIISISLISLILIGILIFLVLPMAKTEKFEKELEKATLKWLTDNEVEIEEEFELSLFQLTGSGYIKMIEEKKDDKYLSPSSIIKINKEKEISLEKKYTSKEIYEEVKNLTYNYPGKYKENIEVNSEVKFEDFLFEVGEGKYNPELIIMDEYNYESMIMTDFESKYTLTYYVHIKEEKLPLKRIIEIKDTKGPEIKFPEKTILKVSEVKNFDVKKDVEVTDNGRAFEYYFTVGNIEELPGQYEIKYIAQDMSGNETEKTRIIIVE